MNSDAEVAAVARSYVEAENANWREPSEENWSRVCNLFRELLRICEPAASRKETEMLKLAILKPTTIGGVDTVTDASGNICMVVGTYETQVEDDRSGEAVGKLDELAAELEKQLGL